MVNLSRMLSLSLTAFLTLSDATSVDFRRKSGSTRSSLREVAKRSNGSGDISATLRSLEMDPLDETAGGRGKGAGTRGRESDEFSIMDDLSLTEGNNGHTGSNVLVTGKGGSKGKGDHTHVPTMDPGTNGTSAPSVTVAPMEGMDDNGGRGGRGRDGKGDKGGKGIRGEDGKGGKGGKGGGKKGKKSKDKGKKSKTYHDSFAPSVSRAPSSLNITSALTNGPTIEPRTNGTSAPPVTVAPTPTPISRAPSLSSNSNDFPTRTPGSESPASIPLPTQGPTIIMPTLPPSTTALSTPFPTMIATSAPTTQTPTMIATSAPTTQTPTMIATSAPTTQTPTINMTSAPSSQTPTLNATTAPSTPTPTLNVTTAPSNPNTTVAPTNTTSPSTSLPPSPTSPPSQTLPTASNPPATADDGIRDLIPFGIQFTTTTEGVPGSVDYNEVALLTDAYLKKYFTFIFEQTIFTNLNNFLTIFVSGSFVFGRPIGMDFESTAFFDPISSSTIPTADDLVILLTEAFVGRNMDAYLLELNSLPSRNVFSTTSSVTFTASSSVPLSVDQKKQIQQAALKAEVVRREGGGGTRSKLILSAMLSIGGSLGLAAFALFMKKRKASTERRGGATKTMDEGEEEANFIGEDCTATVVLLDEESSSSSGTLGPVQHVYISDRPGSSSCTSSDWGHYGFHSKASSSSTTTSPSPKEREEQSLMVDESRRVCEIPNFDEFEDVPVL